MCVFFTVIVGDYVQAVQQLPLVLVDPLHLNVKNGLWIDLNLVLFLQIRSQPLLVFL